MQEGTNGEESMQPNKRGLKQTVSTILLVRKKKKKKPHKIALISGRGA